MFFMCAKWYIVNTMQIFFYLSDFYMIPEYIHIIVIIWYQLIFANKAIYKYKAFVVLINGNINVLVVAYENICGWFEVVISSRIFLDKHHSTLIKK